MSLELSNGEILDFLPRNDAKNRNVKNSVNICRLAEKFMSEYNIQADLSITEQLLKKLYQVKNKSEEWLRVARKFVLVNSETQSEERKGRNTCGRPSLTISDNPCKKVESSILKRNLAQVAASAEEQGISKEEMLRKMMDKAKRSRDWNKAALFDTCSTTSEISIEEITALLYVANLSQRQYQMCRNLLTRYGVEAFPPRNQVDDFKNTLYPHVTVERLSASVSITDSYHSTICNIVSSESLQRNCFQRKLNDIPNHANLVFMVKAGLDGSGSHKKRHQLSGDHLDDTISGSSENFLRVFMTPMSIVCNVDDASVVLWKNPLPNSIFYTRPIQLFKATETRSVIEQIFPNLQSSMDSLEIPHQIEGLFHKCSITTKVTMIDGKMTDILQGDSGAFCHYCDIKRDNASDPLVLFEYGAGGMHITKTIEECYRRWSLVQSGDIGYNNPLRASQCHKPLISKSGRFFAVLHQELRSLDFCLKILYHLVARQKIWSEAYSFVKTEVANAKARVISHVRASCGGLLLDSPMTCGGNTNAGPVAIRFLVLKTEVPFQV